MAEIRINPRNSKHRNLLKGGLLEDGQNYFWKNQIACDITLFFSSKKD
jgi:hypothetical protein